MVSLRRCLLGAALAAPLAAHAQPMLYAQRLPEGTVYIRLANALPADASIGTDFAGTVKLGADGAARISPYYVAGSAGGKVVTLQVTQGGKTLPVTFTPKSGAFVTVVVQEKGGQPEAAVITDHPEYNQLKARLTFYNATPDCTGASLAQGSQAIFKGMAPDSVEARSINPVKATVVASCGGEHAKPLDLGELNAGGLYSVWLMRLGGEPTTFVAIDKIALPQS
jgi:hypothetical protein